MKKTGKLLLFSIFFISSVFANPALAQNKTTEELQKQIEALQKRVGELEAEKKERQNINALYKRGAAWNSLDEIYRMQEEMNRMFQNSFRSRGSGKGLLSSNMSYDASFEIKDKKDNYILEIDMKGLNQDKTSIDINEHSITIKGEQSAEESSEGNGAYISSKSFSSFMRTIPLPSDADTSGLKSEKEGNKLIITLPKKK